MERKRPPHTIDLDATEVARGPIVSDATTAAVTPETVTPESVTPESVTPEPTPEAVFQSPPEAPNEPPQGPAYEPPPEPPRADAVPEPDRPRSQGLPPEFGSRIPWPLLGAGAAGAAGMLLVVLLLWSAGFGSVRKDETDALTPRLASIETQLRDLAARPAPQGIDPKSIDALSARLGKLESAVAAPRPPVVASTDPAIAARLAGTETAVKSLSDSVAALSKRSEDFVQRADDLVKRAAAAGSDHAVRLTVAAAALRTAVERGEPFADELATVKTLAKDSNAVSALEPFAASGVPSNAALAHELSTLIQPMLNIAGTTTRDGGILDRLQANAERLVRIRRVGDATPGDDPTATIARIEAKAAQADVAGALAELGKLPPDVRAPAQGWIAKAQMRGKAIEASRRLADGAFAGLNATP